jgi:hypothetical protein
MNPFLLIECKTMSMRYTNTIVTKYSETYCYCSYYVHLISKFYVHVLCTQTQQGKCQLRFLGAIKIYSNLT